MLNILLLNEIRVAKQSVVCWSLHVCVVLSMQHVLMHTVLVHRLSESARVAANMSFPQLRTDCIR